MRNPKRVKRLFSFACATCQRRFIRRWGVLLSMACNSQKLESYVDPDFNAAFFFAEIRGNLLDLSVQTAFSELETYTEEIKICGCYLAQR